MEPSSQPSQSSPIGGVRICIDGEDLGHIVLEVGEGSRLQTGDPTWGVKLGSLPSLQTYMN